jgi:hypothetical protein
MEDIWGSSASDVYAVGSNDQNRAKMFHYNGQVWEPVKLASTEGGYIFGPINLWSIRGFSKTDIWAVGERLYAVDLPESSLVLHYDGAAWREVEIVRGRRLTTIWGYSSDDIWTGGINGTLYHYDGFRWEKAAFDSTIGFSSIFGYSSTNIFAMCSRYPANIGTDTSQFFFYHYDGRSWTPLTSFKKILGSTVPGDEFGHSRLWGPPGKLYSVSHGIYLYDGESWHVDASMSFGIYGIYGTDELNVIAAGDENHVFQWNGQNWFLFGDLLDIHKLCTSLWCDTAQVFIVSTDGQRSYILHGK